MADSPKIDTPLIKVKRQISYKLPVTLRYGFYLGFFFGLPIAMKTHKPSTLIKAIIFGTLGFGFGTCYQEFSQLIKLELGI